MRTCVYLMGIFATLCCVAFGVAGYTQAQSASSSVSKNQKTMMHHAKGSFEPINTPQPPEDKAAGSTLARMSMNKKYHGDLEASSVGNGVTATTDVKGSAGYVAIERVTGTLNGRKGSFVLQHMGILDRGTARLTVTVVPDSGTGELAGLTISNFNINIEPGGKHFYEFDYTLPNPR
ncbi:MAG TPA: DUF3224 domain-containing protein [Verrucomicrobiae bacterium]|nr:DUF3224 domain-containing protein [Verrucomicrobiae bacterium]